MIVRLGSWHRSTLAFVLATAILSGTGFLFWAAAARWTSAASVGVASAVVGSASLLAVAAKGWSDLALLRGLRGADASRRRRLLRTAALTTAALGVLVAALFVAGGRAAGMSVVDRLSAFELALFAVAVLAWSEYLLLDVVLIAEQGSAAILAKAATFGLARVALLVALAPMGTTGILAAWAAGLVLAVAVALALPRPSRSAGLAAGGSEPERATLVASYLASLIVLAPSAVGSVLVLQLRGPEEAAYFYVVWMFGALAMTAPIAFAQSAVAQGSRPSARILAQVAALTTVLCLGVVLAAAVALPLLGPHYAERGVMPLAPMVFAAVPGVAFHAGLAHFRTVDRPAALLVFPAALVAGMVVSIWTFGSIEQIGWAWLGLHLALGVAAYSTTALPAPVKTESPQ